MALAPDEIEDLYRAERAQIARAVAGIALDSSDDVVQDAFLALLLHDTDAKRPGAWLNRVARNKALNDRRRRRDLPLAAPEDRSPGWDAERAAVRAIVSAAVAVLPERARIALTMRFFDDRSFGDIAEALDVPVEHAHLIVHRAVRALGREMVRALAGAHGAEACTPSLLARAGLDPRAAAHTPCERCERVWHEIEALRALPGLAPALSLKLGWLRRMLGELSARAPGFAPRIEQIAAAVTGVGIALSGSLAPATPPVPFDAPRQPVAGVVRSARGEGAPAPPGSARSVAAQRRTTTNADPQPQPRSTAVATAGPATVHSHDDYTQGDATTPDGEHDGAVVCEPLQPCPPPPSP